ncbi:MAG: cyclic nucleotide-binding domain-containing protein [Balneolaceae bacterium]
MFKKNHIKKIKDQGNIVFKSKLLADLSLTERYELLQLCHRRKYKEGEYIFYQNDPGAGMYFIEDGKVQLIVANGSEEPEQQKYTVDIEAPSEFGVMSISYEIRRMASAKCLTDCTILGFFKPDFETLKKRHPETAVKFLEAVSTRTMKQLELTMRKLRDVADLKTAFIIQFESQYKKDSSED